MTDHENPPERSPPRSAQDIFEDLRVLVQSDGALHEISAMLYRDWVVTVDVAEGRVVDDPEHRWSISKLNKNEFLLLLGLMIQSDHDRTYQIVTADQTFAERADKLLREFHDRVLEDVGISFDPETKTITDREDSLGYLARESIYYGAESFYVHQFLKFGRQRYREDMDWLLRNVGASIRPLLDIAKHIVDHVNMQMNGTIHARQQGHEFNNGDLTNSMLVPKSELRKKFGDKADAFMRKFVTPIRGVNKDFTDPFAINQLAISPIIELGDYLYVPHQYRLMESLYESPFYWMMADKAYEDTHARNRGAFLEATTTQILKSVFGEKNVFENVLVHLDGKDEVGEIDVLVLYGEFVIVVQVKSKRITLKARTGDLSALNKDFSDAIQAPYAQALKCIEAIKAGGTCSTKGGRRLDLHGLPRFFPMVVLSDPFPASTFLSQAMLKQEEGIAPVIWDIGVLDCVGRILPTPIELLFYLKSRSDVFASIMSDSEYNFLGYHLKAKLVLGYDADFMTLERDFAGAIDDFMISADVGAPSERPVGILERLKMPVISDLLADLKQAPPEVASVVIDLYDFSGAMLKDISSTIVDLRNEVRVTGKAIKAFSILTESGGITYAVTRDCNKNAAAAAEAIGVKNKYEQKRDRWYVIVDCIKTENPVDGLAPLVWPWKEDSEAAKQAEMVNQMFKTQHVPRTVGQGFKKAPGS